MNKEGFNLSDMLKTLKVWLSWPHRMPSQKVYMPAWNRRRKKKLDAAKETFLCVCPTKPRKKMPAGYAWQYLPESAAPPLQLYGVARQLVDSQVSAILAYVPDFFKNPELNIDYEPIYKINRQQKLAVSGLPFLSRCLEDHRRAVAQCAPDKLTDETDLPLILDPPLDPMLLKDGELEQHHLSAFSVLFSAQEPLHPDDFKKRGQPLKPPNFNQPTVLVVLSAPVHYELMRTALELLETQATPVIYLARPDKLDAVLKQSLAQRYFTIDADTLLPEETLILGACSYFNLRLLQIASLPVPPTLQASLMAELDWVLDNMQLMLLLETVLANIKPIAVLGCMEKNRMSVAFETLQARYGYKTLNFQHGTMPMTRNMDWLRFDRFFVWNPLTCNVLLQDGYRLPETLAVTGNQAWEQSSDTEKVTKLSSKGSEILAWRGNDPLIGAYTQYSGDFLTAEVRQNYLKSLFAYLEDRPTIKLLIKKHPLETDRLAEEMLARSGLQDRVMLCAGRELDLWESFTLIHLCTSICSGALLDSRRVNVPAAALDFTAIIDQLGYGYEQEPGVLIVREPEAVTTALDALLQSPLSSEMEGKLPVETESLVFPKLSGTYAERIRRELVALNLLI
jgi:hypothetical protein